MSRAKEILKIFKTCKSNLEDLDASRHVIPRGLAARDVFVTLNYDSIVEEAVLREALGRFTKEGVGKVAEHMPEGKILALLRPVARQHIKWEIESTAKVRQPPRCAGGLLTVFAKSPGAAEAAIGCMHELFDRDCAKYGVRHATVYCWGRTVRSLWPLFRRAVARAVKWVAIISAVKRYFVG
jgi:hypothetical protein